MENTTPNNKSPRALREEEVLKFWKKKNIFKKTLEKENSEGEFVFYEGPPTANGRPGIHHIEARSFKDAIPRYKTMQGYHVGRKGGWDTHGLPVELEVEKQLGLKSKKEIEQYGVGKFNEECKKSVWKYVDEWKEFSDRMGYWIDIENPYVTYHNSYIEKVWSVLSHVESRNLLYKDYKVLPWCPRCGTALSSHELAQGYKDVKDLSVYAKFKLTDFPNAYFLAWTTTPWTLPGNVALAVGEDIDYIEAKVGEEIYVLAKERLSILTEPYEIVAEHKGKEMLGMGYEPLYPFLKENYKGDGLEKAYKIYVADFVNTEDGTGIVHTAVMYGQDDFVLGTEIGLPKHHLVDETGHFKTETDFLAGKFVKDEETTVDIIKDLAHRGLLFKKEKYEHSYPHCWRCKTPLIYYARDSWYIAMSKLRDELIKENEKINWEPDYIKEGRFGEWLREIKDWAISRERYWGTPLPVWENADGSKRIVVDSLDTLKKYSKKSGNKYFVMRHGETQANGQGLIDTNISSHTPLSEKGREDVQNAATTLPKVDVIISSPFERTKQTAQIIAKVMGLESSNVLEDGRIGEIQMGQWNGKKWEEYLSTRSVSDRYYKLDDRKETRIDVMKRVGNFLFELEQEYKNKTILIVTHGAPIGLLRVITEMKTIEDLISTSADPEYGIPTSRILPLDFSPFPHNSNFELDLHKPYIDEVVLEKDGEEYKRVKEVMDVWFDSGAMPFASFDSAQDRQYPADFISEAIDQTRGWFYTLHAIGVLMEKGRAYKNVICLGHILDKEGKKMSKSIGNVVNPWEMMDKYGIDTLRLWMYSVNQPGESKNFDERSVDELQKRVFNLLDNVHSFYELYRDRAIEGNELKHEKEDALNTWILARLDELTSEMTNKLDEYKLLEPVRSLREFVDDLSTWYLRRSRDKVKEGDTDTKKTLYFVLKRLSLLMAPFAPFASEDLYQKLRLESDPESVHLEEWPSPKGEGFLSMLTGNTKNEETLEKMNETRRLVSLALEARSKFNIKVRQPLARLEIKTSKLSPEYLEIIKHELNVKEVVANPELNEEVILDTTLTPDLIEEGKMRDAIRAIQEWRKEKNLKPGEKAVYSVPEDQKDLFQKFSDEIKRITNVDFN